MKFKFCSLSPLKLYIHKIANKLPVTQAVISEILLQQKELYKTFFIEIELTYYISCNVKCISCKLAALRMLDLLIICTDDLVGHNLTVSHYCNNRLYYHAILIFPLHLLCDIHSHEICLFFFTRHPSKFLGNCPLSLVFPEKPGLPDRGRANYSGDFSMSNMLRGQ